MSLRDATARLPNPGWGHARGLPNNSGRIKTPSRTPMKGVC